TIRAALTGRQILDFFVAMDQDCAAGQTAPLLFGNLKKSDQAGAIKRLSSSAVATDVPFADHLREFKLLVSSVTGTGRQNDPSDAMCQ
ncbi:unnamed protein product, partial [Sphacelaria rigidula]